MLSNRLAFAALGVACVVAAAGGSYVATRHNAAGSGTPVAATSGVDAAVVPGTATARRAVEETEAVVTSEPAKPAARPQAPRASAKPVQPPSKPVRPPASRPQPETPPPARVELSPVVAPEHTDTLPSLPAPVAPVVPAPVVARDERSAEAQAPAEPARASLEELTVPADSVVGLQTETTLSSERAHVEDRVEARVVRDVRVGGRVAIPAGSRALGSVVVVERGGRARNRARLGIRFHTLALADGTRIPISTETIYRFGNDPANGSAAKVGGGAVAGAILGAIIGGGRGAAIGAATGAAGGGAAVMSGDRSEAVFPSGAQITARIVSPVAVTVEP